MRVKYIISDRCIICNTCLYVCKFGAISKGEVFYTIDEDKCVACGQCRDKCAGDAIDEVDE